MAKVSQRPETHLLIDQPEKKESNRAIRREERKELELTLVQECREAIGVVPPTDESLAEFEQLLQNDRFHRLHELIEMMKAWDPPTTIAEPRSFLYYGHLQPVLVEMLEDIGKYRAYLERFIVRFEAENECIGPKHQAQSKAEEQSGPIHYAVQHLEAGFLDWLLKRPGTDVNLRNGFKKTALNLLCEQYSRKPAADRMEAIRGLIVRLLQAGADFNICCKDKKLPFALLLKQCDAQQPGACDFIARCTELAPGAIAISSMNERNQHVIGFFNNNPNVRLTVELLEIFLRYNDEASFETYLDRFTVTAANVKKVIRLLLHTACEQKLPRCVQLIVRRGEAEIFRVVKRMRKVARKELAPNAPARYMSQESMELQKCSQLEHRVELKGLLKKACEMADLLVLQTLLSKISDLLVLNDDPLLVLTLAKANDSRRRLEERNALLACAEFLANQQTIHINKRDNSGNTALHLALKHGFDAIALILLHQPYTYLGLRNKDNLTPLDYGTYAFWRSYLDQCIEVRRERSVQNRDVIHLNLNGFDPTPPRKDGELGPGDAAHLSATAPPKPKRRSQGWKLVQSADAACDQTRKFARTVTEMTTPRQIAQSKELKRLLVHPVLHTFIMIKWTRLCHWNYLNLVLTALTMGFFGSYSLTACSVDGPRVYLRVLSVLGAVFVVVRELLQLVFLRRSYFSFENTLDLVNVVAMVAVLATGCNGLVSSLVVISFAMQLTFLLGSLQSNSIATMMYMFKTVSKNFLKSFLLFLPLIGAFVFAFHLTYNQSPEGDAPVCARDDCAEENFNNFRTFWNATIKTLVMTTGEFEAAAIDFENGKMLLFMLFMFFAPIVILNLINGLAVSDIAAIREESELISISKKVMLLEQYERGVANVYPGWLRRCLPKPFFTEHSCHILVKTKEYRKIVVNPRAPRLKPREAHAPSDGTTAAAAAATARGQGSSQTSVAVRPGARPKVTERPLAKVPWVPSDEATNVIFNLRCFRLTLFMRLDQTMLDEALAIVEKRQPTATITASKSTPTVELPAAPPFTVAMHKRTVSPGPARTKPRIDSTQMVDMQEELQAVQAQLRTVLELLRRRETLKRKDTHQTALPAGRKAGKKIKRKTHKQLRKVLRKTASEDAGDQ
uniref:Ion transport domain-containing protein n=1 Tax=Anopheles dirus TaxID=7168 RepID=A0A182MZU8_9DIPT